ncbi:MAG TPA: hypothetical protein VLS93_12220 [Anaeromyxobacteraceae bacterium]|nr:hypothetical protein [Anaeromyxobacteraceae bacterium]
MPGPPRDGRAATRRWLAAGALLLAAAAGLLALVERKPRTPAAAIEFPRTMRGPEWERMKARRTLVVAHAPGEPPPEPGEPPARRDPFLAALPARPGDAVVVFEANALRHSRLGEAFVACMLRRDPRTFDEIREETGIDVLKDVDRVAFAGEAVVVSGFFDRARWDRLEREGDLAVSRYGDAGRIWVPRPGAAATEEGVPPDPVMGVWKDQLLVLGPDEESVRLALDQVEGRAEPAVALPDEMAYGEVYGVVPGEALRRLVGGAHGTLADRIAAAASRIEIHVDAMEAVAVVLNVRGEDPARVEELSRALGGALAGARLEAQVSQDRQLADLLDQARVALEGEGAFSLEMAVPADRLEGWFDRCEPPAGEEGPPDGPPD